VQMSLDAGNLSDPRKFHPEDRVSQVVQRSMKEARRKAEQMELYLEEMKKVYNDIMTFFGDDNTDESARREFFSKLANFVNEYKVSLSECSVTAKPCANINHRNRTKRTLLKRKHNVVMKSQCVARLKQVNLLSRRPLQILPPLLRPLHKVPWIHC
jgi:hypothetical protein